MSKCTQGFHFAPGLTGLVCRVEALSEAGDAKYWDGTAGRFVADASARAAIVEDAALPGIYRPAVDYATWPDGCYQFIAMNPNIATADKIAAPPVDVAVVEGSDCSIPTITIPFLGGTITGYGFRFNAPAPRPARA